MGIPGNSREFPGSNFSLPGSETWENRQNPPVTDLQWTRQTRFVLWAGSGQADAPGACLTVLRYPSTRQSHWKCLSGFGEAAPARLPPDLPDSREFPPGVGVPGSSREFPTPEISLPGNCSTIAPHQAECLARVRPGRSLRDDQTKKSSVYKGGNGGSGQQICRRSAVATTGFGR